MSSTDDSGETRYLCSDEWDSSHIVYKNQPQCFKPTLAPENEKLLATNIEGKAPGHWSGEYFLDTTLKRQETKPKTRQMGLYQPEGSLHSNGNERRQATQCKKIFAMDMIKS